MDEKYTQNTKNLEIMAQIMLWCEICTEDKNGAERADEKND
jgi:hypothetical protein